MDKMMAHGLKRSFGLQARKSFEELKASMVDLAEKTYQGDANRMWLAAHLEDILKGWILQDSISLDSCTDANSILARLNRLAGEEIAQSKRGQWQFEKLPPTSLLYKEGEAVDIDEQYALMRSLHQLLNQWEKAKPKQAIALEMYFWGGFNFAEISKSLGASDWTVRTWVNAGVAYLRKALKSNCLHLRHTANGTDVAGRK